MKYRVDYSKRVIKQLDKLDKNNKKTIMDYIKKNLQNCENPRDKGKGLTHNLSGEWRYRIGDYRLICKIYDKQLIIMAISIAHRKEAYKKTSH